MTQRIIVVALLLCAQLNLSAQAYKAKEKKEGGYTYTYYENDPYKTRWYKLANGFTVMLSINKAEPRIQTYVAVRAGSKTDPSSNTGLAHYLEHLMFKGTDKFGTKNFEMEKPYLQAIEQLYSDYNKTKDENARKEIYKSIDSVSGAASKYAIANEYDKMMQSIGATGTNAYTSFEQTVYINNIPSNSLEKFIEIEGERFRKPVFRIFHTELEAVYEEKNISLDNDESKADEAMMEGLFPTHPYGQQTTIGTVEHLKNPSLKRIQEYFNTNYVAGNMAMVMVGDFDMEEAIKLIDKHFSALPSGAYQNPKFAPELQRNGTTSKRVFGPGPEFIKLGFRFPGSGTKEATVLKLINEILYNGKSGLFDIDLIKGQKTGNATSTFYILKDYSVLEINVRPKAAQSAEELIPLVSREFEKLAAGEFDDDLLKGIIANAKVNMQRKMEQNANRADVMLDAFILGLDWSKQLSEIADMSAITKQDVMNAAKVYMTDAFSIAIKKKGSDPNVVKVPKPKITPVEMNANERSTFAKLIANKTSPTLKPEFIDYDKVLSNSKLAEGLDFSYLKNNDNDLFSLVMVWEVGKEHFKNLPMAMQFLKYISTEKYTNDQLNKEFYKLACDYNIQTGGKQTYITLTGSQENLAASVALMEELLNHPKADFDKYMEFLNLVRKGRTDAKLNKRMILNQGLRNFAIYGPLNPFTYTYKDGELQAQNPNILVDRIKDLQNYPHKIFYYGPAKENVVTDLLKKEHVKSTPLKPIPVAHTFPIHFYNKSEQAPAKVYFVDYDMVQAEVMWVRNNNAFDKNELPMVNMFQEYYGGGMGAVVFQTIRESKALAYSCNLVYSIPDNTTEPYRVIAYLGTQADKLSEAIPAMNELIDSMPINEQLFESSKQSLLSGIVTERILKEQIFFSREQLNKLNIKNDIRKETYDKLQTYTVADLKTFFDEHVDGGGYTLCILGSKKNIDIKLLEKYGKVVELQLTDIFGY
jgi:predicted Zn-dependent peptidase